MSSTGGNGIAAGAASDRGHARSALSIAQYLALLLLLVAVPLVLLAFFAVRQVADAERRAALISLMTSARALAAAVDKETDTYEVILWGLARSRFLLAGNLDEFRRVAKEVLAYVPNSIVVLCDPSGRELLNTGTLSGMDRPDCALTADQRQALATRAFQIVDLSLGSSGSTPVASLLFPVFHDEALLYTIAIALPPGRFQELLKAQHYPDGWLVSVLDRQMRFVARFPQGMASVGALASVGWRSAIARGADGYSENKSLEGPVFVTAYTRTARGWTVGVAVDKGTLGEPFWTTQRHLILGAGLCLALSGFLGWLFSRRLTSATGHLQQVADQMALEKSLGPPRGTSIREYDALEAAFVSTSATLRARTEERALAESAREQAQRAMVARLREIETLYDHTPAGLALIDTSLRFVRINRALAEMNGAPAGDHSGRLFWEAVPGLRAVLEPKLRRVMESGETIMAEISGATPRQPGITRFWHVTFYPLKEPDGTVTALGARIDDITERKRADELRATLLNELNHRVKNTLATVQAIARQTLRTAAGPEASEALESRLQALAAAHDVLTRKSWAGAGLVEIITRTTAPYQVGGVNRFQLDGHDVLLPPKGALSFAMAIHELCTNAVKYGALSNSDGRVRLTWHTHGEPARLLLRWEEIGGPPVRKPARQGFGSLLVTRVLADDLDGEVRLEFPASGVVCTIDVPLSTNGRAGLSDDAAS